MNGITSISVSPNKTNLSAIKSQNNTQQQQTNQVKYLNAALTQ